MSRLARCCSWCGAELAGRSHQQYCSAVCRLRAYRAERPAEPLADQPESVADAGLDRNPVRRRETLSLPVPDSLDYESRLVVEYVNREIGRWNAGERDEPLDLILDAARERLRRHDRLGRQR